MLIITEFLLFLISVGNKYHLDYSLPEYPCYPKFSLWRFMVTFYFFFFKIIK